MVKTKFIKGDATEPIGIGNKIILHVCNDIGGWGKGFVLALSKKWKEPEAAYRRWYKSGKNFALGKVQLVKVEEDIWVANLIGQHKTKRHSNGIPPVRYGAIKLGLSEVRKLAKKHNAVVHMPRIACKLAGGKWNEIQPLLDDALSNSGIATIVYDLE